MRAVTFSDPETNELINENFVVSWFNQAPDVFPPNTGAKQPPVDENSRFSRGTAGRNLR